MTTKKTATQLDAEIAEALAHHRIHRDEIEVTSTGRQPLRIRLSRGLGSAVRRRSGIAVFQAMQTTETGNTFESSDGGVVRAFWHALNEVYHRPPSGAGGLAIGRAAGTKIAELQLTIAKFWPEARAEWVQ